MKKKKVPDDEGDEIPDELVAAYDLGRDVLFKTLYGDPAKMSQAEFALFNLMLELCVYNIEIQKANERFARLLDDYESVMNTVQGMNLNQFMSRVTVTDAYRKFQGLEEIIGNMFDSRDKILRQDALEIAEKQHKIILKMGAEVIGKKKEEKLPDFLALIDEGMKPWQTAKDGVKHYNDLIGGIEEVIATLRKYLKLTVN